LKSEIHFKNREQWDERVRRQELYTRPATEQDFEDPLKVLDPCGWLGGDVKGKRLLCLAAGGGRQSVLYAAAGALVTVVDISPRMLELDRQMAAARGLRVRVIEASMDDLSSLPEAGFDLVVQPISTCYVPDVAQVYREVARVIVCDGLYISQHKQPVSLQASLAPMPGGYLLNQPYYRQGPLPEALQNHLHREAGLAEFLHRWEQLIGSLCRSGFVLEDLAEPRHGHWDAAAGTAAHRSWYVPPFVKLKARRRLRINPAPKLWAPS
jgi:SAM-dependent methyltransferase